jgi:transposase-like protein
MKPGIEPHLAGLSLSDTVFILEIFDVERVRSPVQNWVHIADRQPEAGRFSDHVAVDETVIRLNDKQYWPSAAVAPDTNELLYTKLETEDGNGSRSVVFFTELSEKHGNRNASNVS